MNANKIPWGSLPRHENIRRTAEAYGVSIEEATEIVAEEEVHMEMDGDMDIYDLCDHHSSVSYNE